MVVFSDAGDCCKGHRRGAMVVFSDVGDCCKGRRRGAMVVFSDAGDCCKGRQRGRLLQDTAGSYIQLNINKINPNVYRNCRHGILITKMRLRDAHRSLLPWQRRGQRSLLVGVEVDIELLLLLAHEAPLLRLVGVAAACLRHQRQNGGEVAVVDEVAGVEAGALLLELRGDLPEVRVLDVVAGSEPCTAVSSTSIFTGGGGACELEVEEELREAEPELREAEAVRNEAEEASRGLNAGGGVRYVHQGKGMLQRHQLLTEFEALFESDKERCATFEDILRAAKEAIVLPHGFPWPSGLGVVSGTTASSKFVLELDFEPFNASFPRPSMSKSIGNGVQFLNRHLSTNLFQDKESLYPLLNFLKAHNHKGTTMMLNDRIQSLRGLQSALRKADEYLTSIPEDTPSSEFNHREDERLYLANDSDEQSLLCDTLMLSISEHDGEWLIGKQIKGQEIKRMVNVVDSVKEVANMIEVVDAVRQNKKLCHHIRGRMDCRCATLSKLDDAGARKDPID
ncbi:hypothetical protein ACQ4PT_039389 [Festuca glaucescens]